MWYGYVDFTNDGRPFYVGIGDKERVDALQRKQRTNKHANVAAKHGQLREVWYSSDDWTACCWWEQIVINALDTCHYDDPNGIGCNFTRGGEGSVGHIPSAESRAKNSASNKITQNQPELRAKKSAWGRAKRNTPESNARRSRALKGRVLSLESCQKISQSKRGKPRSPEHCANISRGRTGKKFSPQTPEHRRKIGEAQRRYAQRKREERNTYGA